MSFRMAEVCHGALTTSGRRETPWSAAVPRAYRSQAVDRERSRAVVRIQAPILRDVRHCDGTGGGSRALPARIGEWGTLQVLRLDDRWYTTGERAGDTVLWRTTGTTSGTKVAAVIATDSEQAVPMARSGGALWLSADDGVHGRELLRFDP